MRRSISSLLILVLVLPSTVSLAASSPEPVVAVEPYVAHLKLKPEQLRALADGGGGLTPPSRRLTISATGRKRRSLPALPISSSLIR